MQVDDILAARRPVQVVYVLRNDTRHKSAALQFGNRMMRRVGHCARYSPPTGETLRPVAAPLVLILNEFPILHRLPVFPVAIVVPILGDARVRAAPGAGQYRELRMLMNKAGEAVGLFNLAGIRQQGQSLIPYILRSYVQRSTLQLAFRAKPDNEAAIQHFAWSSNENPEKTLLLQRGGKCCIPAGESPPHTDILTYKLTTGLG